MPFRSGSVFVSWTVNGSPLRYRAIQLTVSPPVLGISDVPLITRL